MARDKYKDYDREYNQSHPTVRLPSIEDHIKLKKIADKEKVSPVTSLGNMIRNRYDILIKDNKDV